MYAEVTFPGLGGNETAAPPAKGRVLKTSQTTTESHYARSRVGSTLLSFFSYHPISSAFEGIVTGMYATTGLSPSFVVCARLDWYFARLTFLEHGGSVAPRAPSRRLWSWIRRPDSSG